MRKIFRTIKEYFTLLFDNFVLLLGVGLFVYKLFYFIGYFSRYGGSSFGHYLRINGFLQNKYDVKYNFYITLVWLAIGAILIVVGLLKMREKKNKNQS